MSQAGDYDYDESDELPAGCEYADAQLAHMIGADSRLDGSQTQVQIVCKPLPARRADAGSNVLGYLVAVADDRHVRHIGGTTLACCNGAFVSGFLAAFWRVT